MLVSSDTKDANRGGTILALTAQQAGVKADQGTTVVRSGRDPQSAYTAVVQKMKADGSNFSMVTLGGEQRARAAKRSRAPGPRQLEGPLGMRVLLRQPDVTAERCGVRG